MNESVKEPHSPSSDADNDDAVIVVDKTKEEKDDDDDDDDNRLMTSPTTPTTTAAREAAAAAAAAEATTAGRTLSESHTPQQHHQQQHHHQHHVELKEQFDEDGNVLTVGNLTFVEGILGKGSYGTVRLAKRTTTTTSTSRSTTTTTTTTTGCTIFTRNNNNNNNNNMDMEYQSSAVPQSYYKTRQQQRGRGQQQGRRRHVKLERSVSAPSGDLFFNYNGGSKTWSSSSSSISSHQHHHQHHPTLQKSVSTMLGDMFAPYTSITSTNTLTEDDGEDEEELLVAVKIYNKSLLTKMRTMERNTKTNKVQIKTAYEKVEREIAIMKKFSHPNLLMLYEVIDSPESGNLYMVLEYMPLGELLTYIGNGKFERNTKTQQQKSLSLVLEMGVVNGHFDEAHAALYFVDILHGLGYLHQHHFCHRDLKPENILLDARGIVKISDFGVSHYFEDEQDIGAQRLRLEAAPEQHHPTLLTRLDTDSALEMSGMANAGLLTKTEGTWCFWSPEMCASSSHQQFSGYAADIWAAGICLYIFVTGQLPFYSEVPTELFELISEANVPYKGLGLSNFLQDLLQSTLEKDPTQRAGVGDCLKHSFVQVARNTRIRQLSSEFADSKLRSVVVDQDDIRRAFRIVTTMVNPAVLFKNAQKQIKDGLQAARERLSLGGGSTFSSSTSLHNSSDDDDAAAAAPKSSNKWNPPSSKHVAFFQKGSISSFGSTESESSFVGTSSGKLFPIPQERVITESTRDCGRYPDREDSDLGNVKSNDTWEGEEESKADQCQSPIEKRHPDSSAGVEQAVREKKQKRRASEDACTIQ